MKKVIKKRNFFVIILCIISYGCNIADSNTDGYWTSTTVGTASSGKYVWYVRMSGVFGYLTPSSTSRGIRPVITISKLKLS